MRMITLFRRLAPAFTFLIWFYGPAGAASPDEIDRLARLIGVDDLIAIVREEGIVQGEELREGMFPDASAARWTELLEQVYHTDRLRDKFQSRFALELREADIAPLLEYFASEDGKRVIQLEIDARRAIMEPDVEDVARHVYLERAVDGGPRIDLLESFVATNDFIEFNVMGAMNASLAFFRGLADGGAVEMTEDDILRQVWGQEADIRQDSTEWLYGYMLMAYEPLGDGDLQKYVDLADTNAGRSLNLALFAGFDAMFDEVSYTLGRVAAGFMAGDDI